MSTKVGDEAILQNIALAHSYTDNAEEAKKLTKTALDFAAAADITLTEAVRRLGRAMQGSAGDVSNFAPELKKLTKEQLKAGEATRILGERFAGAAAAQTKTFSGTTTQLQNSFGDLTEEIGFTIIQNQSVISILKELNSIVGSATGSLNSQNQAYKEFLAEGLIGTIQASNTLIKIFD